MKKVLLLLGVIITQLTIATAADLNLSSIRFSKVYFSKEKLTSVVKTLEKMSKSADPNKKGVIIKLSTKAKSYERPISLKMQGVDLASVLNFVCMSSGLKYEIKKSYIYIKTK